MSTHLADRIEKPEYFRINHLKMGRGKRRPYVIGFDSEAHSCSLIDEELRKRGQKHRRCSENGLPFMFQFAHPDGTCDIVPVSLPTKDKPHTALYAFMRYLQPRTQDRSLDCVVYGYNLAYEYTQLFRYLSTEVLERDTFDATDGNGEWKLDVLNAKRYTFSIRWLNSHITVRVVDAMAFVMGGLDSAGELLGLGRKLEKPPLFDRANMYDVDMRAYAIQDAIITQRLGEWITSLHEQHDVRTTISAPQFASRVYRRAYLRDEIALAGEELEQAGLEAYHGGKNGYYLTRPRILKDMWHVDIRSAYPEAMRQLPDPERSEWVYHETYVPGLHAIWRIEGRYKKCRYRGLMTLDGWPRSGRLRTTVTGYELDEALRRDEIELTSCYGWSMDGPDGGSLTDYVDRYYAMKRDAATEPERLTAKLLLNSLYGKFFQKVPNGAVGSIELGTNRYIEHDPDEPYDYRAGGLYHPPIAALITGYVRAKIHGMEHDFESVMTSTDGIFSHKAPPAHLLGKALGQLSAERGRLRIWRERLYIFDPDDGSEQVYALHGFQGKVDALARVPMTAGNIYHYTAQRMVTLRMSTRALGGQRYAPGEFVHEDRQLVLTGAGPPKP